MLIYVLLAAAGVTAAIDHWVDSGVIVGVVVINALIDFLQEGKAEKALDAIRNMLTLKAMVQRDGKNFLMPAEQLVPGDIVSIESGDKTEIGLYDLAHSVCVAHYGNRFLRPVSLGAIIGNID